MIGVLGSLIIKPINGRSMLYPSALKGESKMLLCSHNTMTLRLRQIISHITNSKIQLTGRTQAAGRTTIRRRIPKRPGSNSRFAKRLRQATHSIMRRGQPSARDHFLA
jgi:hypothetical protein